LITGLDSNILCYCLDPAYAEHGRLKGLLVGLSPENRVAVNPTVIHETYHALVFGQKWVPGEARRRLGMVLRHPHIEFSNQTKRVCEVGLALASNHGLGGRDSLILANFLTSKVPVMLTRDYELLSLKEIAWRDFRLKIKDPLR
jgi:predicted nucleic acid-binding protein